MNTRYQKLCTIFLTATLAAALDGCVATGGGYDGDVGISAGFYEPYGYDYGGWGEGYYVGPGYGGERRGDRGGYHPYRPAASGRITPSIPSHARGGAGPARSGPGASGGGSGRR
jgi:hypothetical protein